MIFGIKKSNFIIYVVLFLIGLLCIIFPFMFTGCSCIKEILIGLGCGFIPSSLTAFFVDRANIREENNRILELRNSLLYAVSYGLLYFAKIMIEEFLTENDNKQGSFISIFKNVTETALNFDLKESNVGIRVEKSKSFKNKLPYGLFLCGKYCLSLIENKYALTIDRIFNNDEFGNFQAIFDICEEIKVKDSASEIADKISEVIDAGCSIPEIKAKFDKEIVIENGKIKEWSNLCK